MVPIKRPAQAAAWAHRPDQAVNRPHQRSFARADNRDHRPSPPTAPRLGLSAVIRGSSVRQCARSTRAKPACVGSFRPTAPTARPPPPPARTRARPSAAIIGRQVAAALPAPGASGCARIVSCRLLGSSIQAWPCACRICLQDVGWHGQQRPDQPHALRGPRSALMPAKPALSLVSRARRMATVSRWSSS